MAVRGADVLGFVILNLHGAFVGYIQTICVVEHERGRGIGARLVDHAEKRIFRDSPNVFLCVSSFNPRARALYEKLGYQLIGELKDYLVQGLGLRASKDVGATRLRKEGGGAGAPSIPCLSRESNLKS